MRPFSRLMISLGVFLLVCGLAAWALAGFETRAITALIAGGGGGLVMIVLGFISNSTSRVAMMIGIHLGLIFPLLFTLLFGWRASASWQRVAAEGTQPYLAILLTAMSLACLIGFFLLLRMRPPPESRV